MRQLCLLALCFFSINLTGQNRQILVDDTEVNVWVAGLENRQLNQPVVVFENGLGENIQSWNKIRESATHLGPVVFYDRPGTGGSANDDQSPSMSYHSRKLKKILEALEIAPPYLLVGHSLGAVYIRSFANYYPETLAGLIFVDPADFTQTLEDFAEPFLEIGLSRQYVDSLMRINYLTPKTIDTTRNIRIQQELEMLRQLRASGFEELKQKQLPPLPIHFLVGGRFSVPVQYRAKDYNQEDLFRARTRHWIENWTKVIDQSPFGRLFYSTTAGHYIQEDDPHLVTASIQLAIQDYYRMAQNRN